MAAKENVRQLSTPDNSLTPHHGVLTLFGYGIQVRVDRGHLLIEDGIGEDRRKIRLARVGHGLERLVCIGADGFISLAALQWLAAQDASFVMLERDGSVLATTGPVRPSDAKLRRAQALAHVSGAALRITRELIRQKLSGQELVARHKLLDPATADTIARFIAELPRAENIASIRLIEAQAALAYWTAWRTLPITFPQNDVARIPAHWLNFGARISPLSGSPRLSVNPPNAMLNYLYAVLESEARLAAAALGLDPGLGVLHADSGNRDSLALDLLEPVRPQVDSYVLDWITRQTLTRQWFFEQRDGNCRLMGPFAARLSETATMWRRAVAPIAEWVAQALWNSHQGSSKAIQQLPTRLTHRRRSEGRGNDLKVQTSIAPRQATICEICGADGIKNRYCRSCAVEASRENMAQVALLGHTKLYSQKTKARISKVLSDHAVANTWWDQSSMPDWLTEQFYVEQIQSLLKCKKVREIANAIHVSQPYAAFIRSGRRCPHRRHWLALAGLAGVRQAQSSTAIRDILSD
ncbi:MAG: CRISPR-associated endonuclease Cas1 [Candidatus Sulfotelmatobacter sp.]|jgi:CRISPR-associated endonuclease Cas1